MNVLLLCIEIFLARILDVSLGTVKTAFIVREKRLLASIISFGEILIWFFVAREALNTEIKSVLIPLSYSLGYATGTYLGIFLSSKLIKGNLTVSVISNKINKDDIQLLKAQGFGISIIKMENNKKYLLFEINKKRFDELKNALLSIDNKAFIIVNESKVLYNGFI